MSNEGEHTCEFCGHTVVGTYVYHGFYTTQQLLQMIETGFHFARKNPIKTCGPACKCTTLTAICPACGEIELGYFHTSCQDEKYERWDRLMEALHQVSAPIH